MSWSEIKKAVNSNLNLPLDKKIEQVEEKVEYIGGVIPRGCIKKNVSIIGRPEESQRTLVRVTGSGYVLNMSVTLSHWMDAYTQGYIKVNIDGEDVIYIKPKDGASEKRSISVNYDNSIVASDVELGDLSNLVNIYNGTFKVNTPIRFKSSLTVTGYAGIASSSYSSNVSFTYALEQ